MMYFNFMALFEKLFGVTVGLNVTLDGAGGVVKGSCFIKGK